MVMSDASYSDITSSRANDLHKVATPSTLFDKDLAANALKSLQDDIYVRIRETVVQDNKESDPSSAAYSVVRRPERIVVDSNKQAHEKLEHMSDEMKRTMALSRLS